MKTRFRQNTDEEEAAINAGIAADPDSPEWTEEDFAHARPASEMMPPDLYRALVERRVRGPRTAPTQEAISLPLDPDVLERLRASGPGWQARANAMLRKAVLGR